MSVRSVVGRLAPSPTGALHLGNARSFLLAWLSVRQQRGRLLLRIEDIDSPRVKPWATAATLEDLHWLGLDWDEGPADSDRLVQTNRLPRYREVLDRLIAEQVVYACTCTRSEVAEAASAPHENGLNSLDGPVYPGTCRNQANDAQALLAEQRPFAWRWNFRYQGSPSREAVWRDCLRGEMRAWPDEQLGDFVIARSNGTPAYQLAVVVDDHDMGVTEVVRGDDLIASTFRQQAILQHLNWPSPNYYHVPLIVGADGRRLAKRHGDTRLSTLREQGVTPERVVGYLAWTLGLQGDQTPASAKSLLGKLAWQRVATDPTIFHMEELSIIP